MDDTGLGESGSRIDSLGHPGPGVNIDPGSPGVGVVRCGNSQPAVRCLYQDDSY